MSKVEHICIFIKSLCHDDAESQSWSNKRLLDAQVTLNLPQNLVKVWSSVIQMMASEDTALIYKLLLKLFESIACSEDVYERAVASRSGHQLNCIMFPFCEKSLICLEGKSMTPHRETLFSSVPPSNSLVSVSDPRRAF